MQFVTCPTLKKKLRQIVPMSGLGAMFVLSLCASSTPALAATSAISLAPPVSETALNSTSSKSLISLDFSRASVSDVLEMIGKTGGVDILVGEDVTGTIRTLHLTDKTPDQAVKLVAQMAGVPWKKIDSRTYMVGKNAASSTRTTTEDEIGASSVADPSNINSDIPPLLVPMAPRSSEELKTTANFELNNVKPGIMAYWLDPQNHPKPAEFQASEDIAGDRNRRYTTPRSMAPATTMPNTDQVNGAPSTPEWARPGSGYLPFNPYARSNSQFGGSTGTTSGTSGTSTSGTSSSQATLPSGAGTVALPAGVDNVIAIDAQNVLLVRGTDEGIERIKEIIGFLDKPIAQVEIEAQFVELRNTDSNVFNLTFSRVSSTNSQEPNSASGAADPITGINVSFVTGNVSAGLQASINSGTARLVNAPRVTTFNNLAAQLVATKTQTIPTEQTIIIPNGNGTPITARQTIYTSINSGTVLTVIPTVLRDGTINISLQPSVQDSSPSTIEGSPFPDISSQQIVTSANIKDGDTLAIGGFRTQKDRDIKGRIPLLSRIPIIGSLFRSKNKLRSETDLIIFVTARVVRTTNEPVPGT